MAQDQMKTNAQNLDGRYKPSKPSDFVEHGLQPASIQFHPPVRPSGSGRIRPASAQSTAKPTTPNR